jgi:hypothetical protein
MQLVIRKKNDLVYINNLLLSLINMRKNKSPSPLTKNYFDYKQNLNSYKDLHQIKQSKSNKNNLFD